MLIYNVFFILFIQCIWACDSVFKKPESECHELCAVSFLLTNIMLTLEGQDYTDVLSC